MDDTASLLQQLRRGLDLAAWHAAVDSLSAAHSVMTYGIGPAASIDYLALLVNNLHASMVGTDLDVAPLATEA